MDARNMFPLDAVTGYSKVKDAKNMFPPTGCSEVKDARNVFPPLDADNLWMQGTCSHWMQ